MYCILERESTHALAASSLPASSFAHIMMRLAKEGLRLTDLLLSISCIPDTRAKVLFRKRRFQPPT